LGCRRKRQRTKPRSRIIISKAPGTEAGSEGSFTGISAKQPEMLYTRTYFRSCQCCRDPKSVHFEFSRYPNINTVGKWEQQTIHEAGGISKQQKDKRISTQAFVNKMKADHLYAAFASIPEMGGRDYCLLLTSRRPRRRSRRSAWSKESRFARTSTT
jgi:hypothetical protein